MAQEGQDPAGGYVYLIEGPGGLFKIGRSVNPLTRLAQIAPRDAGLKLLTYIPTSDTVWLERFMHEAFSHRRVKGEWFYLSVADVRLISSVAVECNTIDDLPSAVVAQRVLNEANGFAWGERNDKMPLPVRDTGFTINLGEDRMLVIQQYIRRLKVPVKPAAVVIAAVEQFLAEEGLWPPKEQP